MFQKRIGVGAVAAIALLGIGCGEQPPGTADAANVTQANADGVAPTYQQITELLKTDGVLALPAFAKKRGAHELFVEANIVPLESGESKTGIGRLAEPMVLEIATDFVGEPADAASLFTLADMDGDVHFESHSGWNDESSRNYLVKSLASSRFRPEVKAMLFDPDLSAHYYWFQIYDVGGSFSQVDLFIIAPSGHQELPPEAIVVKVTSVDS